MNAPRIGWTARREGAAASVHGAGNAAKALACNAVMAALCLVFALLFALPGVALADEQTALRGAGLTTQAGAISPQVTARTKAEIIDRLAQNSDLMDARVAYSVEPVNYTEMGELTGQSKQAALAVLNNYRFIAGLDEVGLNAEQGRLAQAATFADYSIGRLTHYPASEGTKPDSMPDELWQLGIQGAGSTNIAAGYGFLGAVHGWMEDSDGYNIDRLGHRRWCLNPKMGTTGFGYVGGYAAMYSFDNSGSGSQRYVAWPAQKTPVEYFDGSYAWSLSVGSSISDTSAVKVTLTRKGDGKTWVFSTLSASTPTSSADDYFTVNNGGYGQTGCIIFRPGGLQVSAGDEFHVEATGVNGNTVAYDVEFFSGYPIESIAFEDDTCYLSYDGTRFSPTVTPTSASGYEIEWSSSDQSVFAVDANGALTKVGLGEATLTATVPGRYTKSGSPITATARVVVSKDIWDCDVEVDFASCEYTGSPIQPKVTVTDPDTNQTLAEGEDYTVSVGSDAVEPDDYCIVWVYGNNKYYGNKGVYAFVYKRALDASMVTVSPASFEYSGSAQHPQVKVMFGGTQLAEGSDYTLSFDDATAVGDHVVTVWGAGNHFSDWCTKSFAITQKALTGDMLTVGASELVYNGRSQKPDVSLAFNGVALREGTDYELSVSSAAGAAGAGSGAAIDVGSYKLVITGKGNFKGSLERDFSIKAADVAVKGGKQIDAAGSLTYGQKLSELAIQNADFVAAGTSTAVAGVFALEGASSVPNAGAHTVTWTFKPTDGNYNTLTGTLKATVKKATPQIMTAPTLDSFAYHPTKALSSRAVSGAASVAGSWQWDDASAVPTVPGGTFVCRFVPSDASNYESVPCDVRVSVTKATPADLAAQAAKIVYGQSLADSALSGTACYAKDDATEVAGVFSWVNGDIKPSVADSGTTSYTVAFTPSDTANYNAVETTVTLQVDKAERPTSWPSEEYKPARSVESLSNDLLASAEGWAFDNAVLGTPLQIGETVEFTARYVAPDAGNYENVTAQVKVTRMACDHATVERRGAEEATCAESGWTGDVYCTICGELVESGQAIAALGHLFDEWVVVTPATCADEGLEQLVCSRCGTAQEGSERVLAKAEHVYGDWSVVSEATTKAEGLKQRSCENCGTVEEASIPKVPTAIPTAITPETPAAKASVVKQITSAKNDNDPKGSQYGLLKAKGVAKTTTSNKITWSKVEGAASYIVYGNRCGKGMKYKKLKEVKGTTFTHKKLKKGTYYKYLIVAVSGDKALTTSKTIHVSTNGGKLGNPGSVAFTNLKKSSKTLKVGKSFTLKAKYVAKSKKQKVKKHRAVLFESSDPSVASVSAKSGKIRAKGKGSCIVYAYAQNGVYRTLKVKVK